MTRLHHGIPVVGPGRHIPGRYRLSRPLPNVGVFFVYTCARSGALPNIGLATIFEDWLTPPYRVIHAGAPRSSAHPRAPVARAENQVLLT